MNNFDFDFSKVKVMASKAKDKLENVGQKIKTQIDNFENDGQTASSGGTGPTFDYQQSYENIQIGSRTIKIIK